jgi:hypothetical protein
MVNFTPRPLYPQGKEPWYPLDWRLGGHQIRSGRGGEEKNSQLPPGIEPQNTDRPTRSPALYPLNYHGSTFQYIFKKINSVISKNYNFSSKYITIFLPNILSIVSLLHSSFNIVTIYFSECRKKKQKKANHPFRYKFVAAKIFSLNSRHYSCLHFVKYLPVFFFSINDLHLKGMELYSVTRTSFMHDEPFPLQSRYILICPSCKLKVIFDRYKLKLHISNADFDTKFNKIPSRFFGDKICGRTTEAEYQFWVHFMNFKQRRRIKFELRQVKGHNSR